MDMSYVTLNTVNYCMGPIPNYFPMDDPSQIRGNGWPVDVSYGESSSDKGI